MTLAIVVDPEYSELELLAGQMPVRVVDSPRHRSVADDWWKLRGVSDALHGITLFKVMNENDAQVNCLNIIEQADLHHGVYSSGMPIRKLKVIGAQPSKVLKEKLRTYGFLTFELTRDGFVAII